MKILATSDLHGDFETLKKLEEVVGEYDVVVIAGDFTNFSSAKVAKHMLSELESRANKLLVVPGNCDLEETSELYREHGISLHGIGKVIGEIGFFGVGGSNITPFNTPLEYSDDEIKEILEQGFEAVKDSKVKILVSHPPPLGAVDQTSGGVHAGSEVLSDFLKDHHVDLVLCGHIHEGKGSEKLGTTLVINSGPTSNGYASIRIGDDEKISYEFLDI